MQHVANYVAQLKLMILLTDIKRIQLLKVSLISLQLSIRFLTNVKFIVKYLYDTTYYILCYSNSNANNILTTYADADYCGDLDDYKSQSRVVILLNKAPILWLSHEQLCTASSTVESKHIAAYLAGIETMWIHRLLQDIGY